MIVNLDVTFQDIFIVFEIHTSLDHVMNWIGQDKDQKSVRQVLGGRAITRQFSSAGILDFGSKISQIGTKWRQILD